MLPASALQEIRQALEQAQNPLFLFDDDTDGLCAFLLLYKHVQRGHWAVIKSSPEVSADYLHKVEEHQPDAVFVLDKPLISQDFIDKIQVPLLWIDHHEPVSRKGVRYYNPQVFQPNVYLPTSYLCYQVVKENLWIAMCGIVGDYHLPEFAGEFAAAYPDLWGPVHTPGDALYKTELGRLTRLLNFLLKGPTSEVKQSIRILLRIQSPSEVLLHETPAAKFLLARYEKIHRQYKELYTKAVAARTRSPILLFCYPSQKMSFTGDLANELSYRYPKKLVVIGREKDGQVRMSLRSKAYKVRPLVEQALEGTRGTGGGHEYACGVNVPSDTLSLFLDNLKKALKQRA